MHPREHLVTHDLNGTSCTCGFYPSSMSDRPGETMALHICQANKDCHAWTECRITATCQHRRDQFPWLDAHF